MNTHELLSPATKAEAAALMTVAGNLAHPDWWKAINGICDLERGLSGEAREQFYEFLSAHDASNIDDCREVYRDDHDFL